MTDNWSMLESDFHAVERTLLELLERTQALATHLVDRGGRIVMTVGPDVEYDLNSFASLAAADVAANDELMRLFGGTQVDGVACLGSQRSMASCLIADRLVLCVVFDRRSTLGLVRHRMRRAAEKLTPVFQGLFAKLGVAGAPEPKLAEAAPVPAGAGAAGRAGAPVAVPERFGVEAAAALDDLLGGDIG